MSDLLLESLSCLPAESAANLTLHSRNALAGQGITVPPEAENLFRACAGNSEFLSKLIAQDGQFFLHLLHHPLSVTFEQVLSSLNACRETGCSLEQCMRLLRKARNRIALLTAMADISGTWNAKVATRHLSQFADAAIRCTCDFLLAQAHHKGIIALPEPKNPESGSGLLVLAMGKLGGYELNYSSDIDLIILFDDEALPYHGRHSIQHFFNGVARDLCILLSERTQEGYVFRTDLRLRPDPRSMPLAVRLISAIHYYESLGQNWERAAMIKARSVYGDALARKQFERTLQSFIWRRHLDFAAIADINSIKRQINAKIGEKLELGGHNVKLGRGGIREIEFFVQTQQLVWGGREPSLRVRSTDQTLRMLHQCQLITQENYHFLEGAYWYLRRIEHYIQMLKDEQNHTLPESAQEQKQLATFLGYASIEAFAQEYLDTVERVHGIYAESMRSAPPLSVDGNLVFTGVEADPDTLKTLARMGFADPQHISDEIQDWHRGGRRATRTLRARQLLTELTPALLQAFALTPNPDDAFRNFDAFINRVPVGVQIFSLLSQRPEVMSLLSLILGGAPALSHSLSRNPTLLDGLLENDSPLPNKEALKTSLDERLSVAMNYEDSLRVLRHFKQEQSFHAGVRMLRGHVNTARCGEFLSQLADILIYETYRLTRIEFEKKFGILECAEFAIIGMGKLGSCELTFDSDIDVILIYDACESRLSQKGSLDAYTYFQRFASRLTNAFTLMTKEGTLYELDMRLRPGGSSGALATGIERFAEYFQQDGWDVEALALTRARIVSSSSSAFSGQIEQICLKLIHEGSAKPQLGQSLLQLRERIFQQQSITDPWKVKFIPGGILDLSLLSQYLRLGYPNIFGEALGLKPNEIFSSLESYGVLSPKKAEKLMSAYLLQRDVQHVLRLCSTLGTVDDKSSESLKTLIARLLGRSGCEQIRAELLTKQKKANELVSDLLQSNGPN